MSSLYEISAKFHAAMQKLEAAETEAEYYDAEVALAALDAEKDEKLVACVAYLKNVDSHREAIDIEIERLKAKSKAMREKSEKFEIYLGKCIGEGNRWTNGVHSLGWRKSEAVKITDQDAVPSQYLREVLKYEPDKTQIKIDLKCGATIPGCELEVRQNIQIK